LRATVRTFIVVCGAGERAGRKDDDAAPFKRDPFALGPDAQLLVDALARRSQHLTDLVLGNFEFASIGRHAGRFGKSQQHAGKPRR
jgi:hypothetical protein